MSAFETRWAHSVKVGNQTAKQLLCFLSVHTFSKPGMHFKNATIAGILEITERAVQKAKALLIKKGFIKIVPQYNEKGAQISNITYLNIPQEVVDKYTSEMGGEGERCAPLGVHDVHGGGERHASPPLEKRVVSDSKIEQNFEKKFPNNKYINNNSNNKSFCKKRVTSKRKKPSEIPANFVANDNHILRAKQYGLDVFLELEKFKNWHGSRGNKFVSHDMAFTSWLIKAKEIKEKSSNKLNETGYASVESQSTSYRSFN